MKRAYIITGGEANIQFIKEVLTKKTRSSIIVAVDAGLEYIDKLNIKPNILIGDFDTVNYDILDKYIDDEDVQIHRHSPIKDLSDTELAINCCIEQGYHEIFILAALGNRVDHSLANIYLICKELDRDVYIKILDEYNKIYAYDHSFSIDKDEAWGKYLTIYPMGGEIENFSILGVKYPLYNQTINKYKHPTLTLSNEIIADCATINFTKGLLLVIESTDAK